MKSFSKIIAVLLVMVMTLTILPVSAFAASAATTSDPASVSAVIKRLGGADRYETSTKIAQEGWTSADTVVLASANSYADALAGAPLARAKNAPIMLVSGKSVNAKVMAQIKALGAKTVYLLGGTAAISAEIEAELTKAGYTVIRLWDSTRYGTAVAVAKELVKVNGNPSEVFIASGVNYPDALSASSIAGIKGVPILYAPANGVLDDATIAFIKSAAPGKAFILGGTAAIDNAVVGKLTNAGVASNERLGGNDRYDTSLIITKKFDSVFTSKDISIATGKNYPDALAGGAFSAKKGIPVLLTDNASVNSNLKAYIAGKDPAVAYVFGGESVVSDAIVKAYLPASAPTTTTTESTTTATTAAPSTPATPAPVPSITRYKVTFEANGDNVENMPAEQRVKKNQCATEPAEPTREGYTFEGWYTEAECVNEFDFATKITKKVTLYAKWVESSTALRVAFYANSDNVDNLPSAQSVLKGNCAVEPAAPTKDDFTFIGWYFEPNGFCDIFDFNEPVDSNIELYARWYNDNDTTDTDNDGLTDSLEEQFGSDPAKTDTDDDGVGDFNELDWLNSNPAVDDSNNDGVSDGEDDADSDGLTNAEEDSLGTNPAYYDSDYDYLSEYDELKKYNTDPLKEDTDGDGVLDGIEVLNGSDPLLAESEFTSSASYGDINENDPISASVVANTDSEGASTLEISEATREDNPFISSIIPGMIGYPIEVSTRGNLKGATLTFTYDTSLGTLGDDFQPRIYHLDETTGELTELPNQIVENGKVIVTLEHFSTYLLLNKVDFDTVWNSEIKPEDYQGSGKTGVDIVFVVDSSGSMGGTYGNDKTGLRITAVKEFIDNLGANDRAAVIDFDSSYRVYQDFTSDHTLLYSAVEKVNSSGGTNLSAGISSAIGLFTSSAYTRTDAYKYIVFLTDGDGTYNTSYTQNAKDNGIVIFTIGLGSGVKESVLQAIASGTDGKYYFASTSTNLPDIYDEIAFETVDYSSDSNNDGITDYYTELLNSGDLLTTNGVPTYIGVIDMFGEECADWDGDGLLNGEEITVVSRKNGVCIFEDTHALIADTDGDGLNDKVEVEMDTDPRRPTKMGGAAIELLCDDGLYTAPYQAWEEKTTASIAKLFDWQKTADSKAFFINYFTTYASEESIKKNAEAIERNSQRDLALEYIEATVSIIKNVKNVVDITTTASYDDGGTYKNSIRMYNQHHKKLWENFNQKDYDKVIESAHMDIIEPSVEFVSGAKNLIEKDEALNKVEGATTAVKGLSALYEILQEKGKVPLVKMPKQLQKVSTSYQKWLNKNSSFGVTRGCVIDCAFEAVDIGVNIAKVNQLYGKLAANNEAFIEYIDLLDYITQKSDPKYVRNAAGDIVKLILDESGTEYFEQVALACVTSNAKNFLDITLSIIGDFCPYVKIAKVCLDVAEMLIDFTGAPGYAKALVNAQCADMITRGCMQQLKGLYSIEGIYYSYDDEDLEVVNLYLTQLLQSRIVGESKTYTYLIEDSSFISKWLTGVSEEELKESKELVLNSLYTRGDILELHYSTKPLETA